MISRIKISTLFKSEIISGLALIVSFVMAVCVANVDAWWEPYKNFVFFPISFGYGRFVYETSLINLVNDGLMSLFFLLVGLELKFHLVCGEFQDSKTLILPSIAALGGILIPALIYICFNFGSSTLKGWAIPIGTDTAFMLGILSFFSKIITSKLRAFIIGFSLIDDALALLILAVFYTKSSHWIAVVISMGLILVLWILNRCQIQRSFYYLVMGIFLWGAMVESGIHGTLCGVVIAFAIPVQENGKLNPSFSGLENVLRPLVYFLILPLFAFINSGINFDSFSQEILMSKITLGIIFGLFVGKQLGVFLFSYVAVKKKWCSLPENVSWPKFYAISVLGGIGFTLSLFIGDLTFETDAPNYAMRAGVIIGSLLSATLGTALLIYLSHTKNRSH